MSNQKNMISLIINLP